jgi:hypothetical protein
MRRGILKLFSKMFVFFREDAATDISREPLFDRIRHCAANLVSAKLVDNSLEAVKVTK